MLCKYDMMMGLRLNSHSVPPIGYQEHLVDRSLRGRLGKLIFPFCLPLSSRIISKGTFLAADRGARYLDEVRSRFGSCENSELSENTRNLLFLFDFRQCHVLLRIDTKLSHGLYVAVSR